MCELTVADGFVEINENLGDMIKYVANEPSVGLYYIQQHVQNAIPNVVRLNNNVKDKSNEVSLHSEDLEDSIAMTRTMKLCGAPIIDEMLRDIKSSISIISSKKPIRGVISQRGPGSRSWGPTSESYITSVFKTAKEKAGNLRWPQVDSKEASEPEKSTQVEEAEELPISSYFENKIIEENDVLTEGKTRELVSEEGDFEEFRAEKEALLEEWLTSSGSVL